MHPIITALRQEAEAAKATLGQPSANDATFRALLVEIFHGQDMQNRVARWLGTVSMHLDSLDQCIAELQAQTPTVVAEGGPVADVSFDEHALVDIIPPVAGKEGANGHGTGHRRR